MKNYPPEALVKTWLFLANADTQSPEAKLRAKTRIVEVLGSEEVAVIYIEQYELLKRERA